MSPERFSLANSDIVVEETPAGEVARVERGDRVEWTKVLSDDTIEALEEVARRA